MTSLFAPIKPVYVNFCFVPLCVGKVTSLSVWLVARTGFDADVVFGACAEKFSGSMLLALATKDKKWRDHSLLTE